MISCGNYEEMIIYMDGPGEYEFSLQLNVRKQIYDDNQP